MQKENSKKLTAQIEDLRSQLTDVSAKANFANELKKQICALKNVEEERVAIVTQLENEKKHTAELNLQIEDLQTQLTDTRSKSELVQEQFNSLKDIEQEKEAVVAKLSAASKHTANLNIQVTDLQRQLSDTRSKTKLLEEKISSLQDDNQEKDSQLSGADRLVKIHDKECTRLLNDIESKTEEVETMKLKIQNLESSKKKSAFNN